MNIALNSEEVIRWKEVFMVLSMDATTEFWPALGLHFDIQLTVQQVSREFEQRYDELQNRDHLSPEDYGELEGKLVYWALLELESRVGERETSFLVNWGKHVSTLREKILSWWANVFEAFGELDDSELKQLRVSESHLKQLREMIRTQLIDLGRQTLKRVEELERSPMSEWDKAVCARYSEAFIPLDSILAFVERWQTKLVWDYLVRTFSKGEFIALTAWAEEYCNKRGTGYWGAPDFVRQEFAEK